METADEKPYAGKCLLLVDDDAEASASQAEILGLMGAEVERIIVRPGAFPEAVAEVRAKLLGQRFDLALIDNNLPGRDLGQSLIKRIVGQIGDHNPVRLVLLTADAALGGVPYDREALRAKGLVGMVHRPLTHQALQCLLSGEDVWEAEAPSSEASTAGHVPLAAQPGTAAAPTPRTILDGIAVQPAVRFALLVRARRRIEARDLIGAGAIPFSLENYSDALARTELRMLVDGPIASLDIRARDAGNEMLRIGSSGIAHWRIIPLGATPWVFGVGVADEQDVASRLPLWISALTATLEVQQWREWAHHVSSFVQLGMAHQGLSHEVFNLQSEFRDLLRTLSRRIALIKPQHQLQEDAKSKIEETVLKLVHASQELLEFSKRQLREQALRLREVYVPEATATIRRIVAEEFREAEVALHLGTPPALALPAPNAALVLPLVNLLINAAKHHYRAENRRVELLFDLGDVNGNPELIADVRDNGPGLDQTALERLWEPGFSTPPDSERRHGMGLWLARRLVEEAGGSLVLHQHWRGLGAWFRLRLPIKPRMTEREPFLIDKDVEVAPRVLLVIDDSEAFRESIELEGEYRGWTVMASDDMQEVLGWLPKHLPDAVLLDWNLPGQQRRDFTKMLRERELTKRTLLLSSGEMDDPRRKLISEFGLAGFKLKPLDLDRLDEEIRLPKRSQEWPGLEAMAYQVDVCIDILDHSLNPRWSNADAREEPLTLEQRLIVQWLRAYIIDRKHKAARRLDWDGRKQCFLESRLFTLRNGDFWLARDWRDKSDRPHDHELLNIDRSDELKDWLQAVARLLAQRYAISRFRVYKIAPLTGTASSRERMEPLIMPLFQSGGGFATSDGVWLGSGFLASENPAVHRALAEDYEPAPEHVTDESPNLGCKEIRYGPQGTSRVLFPVHNEHGAPVALFALDRRLDHAEKLEGFDREVVQIATRMASDEAGVLSNEQWSLMKGLVEDIGERLMTRRLRADEDRREKEWHEAISTAMRDTFSEAGRSPEMTYEGLSQICAQLRDAWAADEISGDVMGTTSWDQAQGLPPILTWCIALLSDDNRWQSVAGSGAVYDECRREGQQQLKEPHRTAAKADAWQAVVIQDFQRWLESADTSIYNCISLAQRRQIRSWLAVPMQVDGKVRALMIAHSPHAHYFSAFRVRLMEHAAKRLLPLLAAAQREIRTRSAFTAAVMYEVKNDSHAALLLLKQIVAEHAPGPPSEALTDIYHYVEGLNALGQDALDVFQLGRGERFQDPTGPERDQTVILGDLLGGMTLGWVTLYEDTRLDIDLPEPLGRRRIRIIRASSFRRVARILMHNAFRHGREWVRIAVHLQESQNADTRLLIEVSNLAYEEIASSLAERLNLAIARLGSSPLARGRLGLAVARQLTTESGGTLGEFESASTNDEDLVTVKISLSWPIQSITENQDETT